MSLTSGVLLVVVVVVVIIVVGDVVLIDVVVVVVAVAIIVVVIVSFTPLCCCGCCCCNCELSILLYSRFFLQQTCYVCSSLFFIFGFFKVCTYAKFQYQKIDDDNN